MSKELKVGDKVAVRIVNEHLGAPVTDWRGKIVMLCKNGKVAVQFRGGKKGRGKISEMVVERESVHLVDDALASRSEVVAGVMEAVAGSGQKI